jgi:hypothetical protein
MRLSIGGLAVASGLLWGGGLLFVGLMNLVIPSYGLGFLQTMSSVYPWFHASHSIGDVFIGAVDGLVDGFFAGILFGWLYNLTLAKFSRP